MDYEKKYNEALNQAKFYHGNCPSEPERKKLEKMFPELAESEDERIRKIIRLALIASEDELSDFYKVHKIHRKECTDWLEKQKEQKRSLNFDVISSWLRDHVSRYVNSEYNEFHHCVEYDGTINVERLIADLKVAVDGGAFDVHKQKEQKPVKLNDDTEVGLDRALQIVKDAKGNLRGYQSDDGIYECCHAIQTLENILKNGIEQKPVHTAKEMWKEMRLEVYAQASGNRHEPNYSDDSTKMFSLCDIDEIFEKIGNSTVGSQPAEWSEDIIRKAVKEVGLTQHQINWFKSNVFPPKQEWSEEDSLHLKNAILSAEKEWGNESCTATWLKSLPERFSPQPKQEWSEEDEKIRQSIIKDIEFDRNYTFAETGKVIEKYNEQITWLKSLRLRPSWKPSEEQMEVLERAIVKMHTPEDIPVLAELRDNLKKL